MDKIRKFKPRSMFVSVILTLLYFFFFLRPPFFTFADNFPTHLSPVDNNIAINSGSYDNNPASPIAVFPALDFWSWTPKLPVFGGRNAIATAVIIVITLLNIIVYYLRRLSEENLGETNTPSPSSSSSLEQRCRRFSLAEIQSATHNFDDAFVIGKGGFGKVYKGIIDDGATIVAIKRLDWNSKQGAHEFWTEIEMLSKFRHIHIVSLIGYCDDCHEMILVYEYMPRGTLSDHLHKVDRNGNFLLSWEQRLKICIGAARGLDYLHTGIGAWHRVIHRDVKSSNILLDENWVAKISDFGLSKIGPANISCTHVSTNIKGTFGYLDPEYFLTRRLTKKSDVYAFGVVLFEVLCGRLAVDLRLDDEQQSLALWAKHCIIEGTHDQMIDPSLRGQISQHSLKTFVEIADRCLHNHPNKRPTMVDVVASLEFALASQESIDEVISVDNHGEHDNQIDGITPLGNASDPIGFGQSGITPNMGGIKKKGFWGIDLWRRKKSTGSSRGLRWDSFWRHRERPSKTKSLPLPLPLSEVHSRRFSLAEIQAATHDFHREHLIAYGICEVYKGYINGGETEVVIKKFEPHTQEQALFFFCNEINVLSRIHHLHVASLIGYCYDECAMILVYDYTAHETLRDHLCFRKNTKIHPLLWKQRLQICIDAARGLNYLHTGTTQTIIHRGLNSTSILLDENLVAKVSNFELSKLGHDDLESPVSTAVRGINCNGYMDPEYALSGRLTAKTDVYSFGVVLLEVLCARQPWIFSKDEDQRELRYFVKTSITKKTLHQIIDPHLMGKIAPECLREFIKTSLSCLVDQQKKRPSMSDVVESLVIALQLQENAEERAGGGILNLDWVNMYSEISSHLVDSDINMDPARTMTDDARSCPATATFDFDGMLFER